MFSLLMWAVFSILHNIVPYIQTTKKKKLVTWKCKCVCYQYSTISCYCWMGKNNFSGDALTSKQINVVQQTNEKWRKIGKQCVL